MNSFRSGKNWLSSKVQGHSSQAKKETNKQLALTIQRNRIAKDPNVRTTTRIRAAGDAVKHSIDEHSHKRNADVNKHGFKHNV